jgi:hypothetical protein
MPAVNVRRGPCDVKAEPGMTSDRAGISHGVTPGLTSPAWPTAHSLRSSWPAPLQTPKSADVMYVCLHHDGKVTTRLARRNDMDVCLWQESNRTSGVAAAIDIDVCRGFSDRARAGGRDPCRRRPKRPPWWGAGDVRRCERRERPAAARASDPRAVCMRGTRRHPTHRSRRTRLGRSRPVAGARIHAPSMRRFGLNRPPTG